MQYLKGLNYAEYLKRHLMVREIDPWRRDEEDKKFYCLLIPMDTALEECKGWSGQDITRTELTNHLKLNNIWIVRDTNEFQKKREEAVLERKKDREDKKIRAKRILSDEERKRRSEQMRLLRNSEKILSP